ncbi:MAG TPA: hypothetical protein VN132_12030 [Bdellovibrio sp.]|nr:hypothetical protein [Bdellovibrio sp.]
MQFKIIAWIVFSLCLVECSSTPVKQGPSWIHEPTRIVDNGYIVYVESAVAKDNDKATFKAEGLALSDLANECSFIPKGTRIEDRYFLDENSSGENKEKVAYVKLAVEFQECDLAQKTIQPDEIKKIASTSFTQQLKRYQDYEETGEVPSRSEVAQLEPLQEIPPAPAQQPSWNSDIHYYAVRQYVVYQKEVVVLSPPTAYAPASPESQTFVRGISPAVTQVNTAQAQNANLKTNPTPWSRLANQPRVERPHILRSEQARSLREDHHFNKYMKSPPPMQNPSPKKHGRHHRNNNSYEH